MQTVLALVTAVSHTSLFAEAAGTLSGVTLRWVEYEREEQIHGLVEQLLASQPVDAVYLGPMPYDHSRELLPADLPVTVLRYGSLELTLAFSKAFARGWAPTPVSIDTFDRPVVHEVAQALGLDETTIGCQPYTSGQSIEDIAAAHRDFLARAGGGYVITSRTAVARRLAADRPDIGQIQAIAALSTVRAQLHELVLRVQATRTSALRFAAGVFTVLPNGSAHPDRARVALQNMLLNRPEFADAWIENRGKRGVLVFAHKALLDTVTEGWLSVPVLGAAEEHLGFGLAAGFGLGSSARTSVLLAEHAATRAEADGGGCAYLIGDDGVIIGPMGRDAARLEFTYREHDSRIEDLAKRVGLSPVTLSRLAAIDRKLAAKPISPAELAAELGITDPSGRRLLRTLRTHGLATIVGSAQNNRKGRPIRLYRLRIDNDRGETPSEP